MKKFQLNSVFALVFFSCLWSCNVYHTAPGTISEAVESDNRVRVLTKDNKSFELKSLYQKGNELVGITGKGSETAKMLNERKQESNGKDVLITFQEDEILAVYLKNRGMSRAVNYGVPVIGAAGLITITSSNFRPSVGY